MMKKAFSFVCIGALGILFCTGCSEHSDGKDDSGKNPPVPTYEGYARPGSVLVLNQGARSEQNSSITYLAPDGTIEENVYRKVNGTSLGNEAQDLYLQGGKWYFLSNNLYTPNDEQGDGVLVIADAVTLKREKVYGIGDLKFKRPEGSKDTLEMLPLNMPLENIAVLDEKNIFFQDGQGVFRFDSTTGELNIVEGSYNFGNQGNTIENVAITRGILKVGDCLYCGGGGFWQSTRLFEFSKGLNEVSRVLPDLKGEFISGLCQTGEREIMLATCGRGGEKNSYLIFVDLDKWQVTKEKKIAEDISAEFFNTSGITLIGDYIYYAAGSTKIRRLSLKTFQGEDWIDVTKDAPEAEYLNCNVISDPANGCLYVAVSDDYSESVIPGNNYLLVYDCTGEQPELLKKIHNQTSYPIGVFPVSKFY